MSNPLPAPGWYPAAHANNEQRYWDGSQWLEPQPAGATTTVLPGSAATTGEGTAAKPAPILGIFALISGIVAFFCGIVPVLGVIIGLAAVGLGIFALAKKQPKGLAITGIALGALGMVASIGVTAGISSTLSSSDRPSAVSVQTSEPVEEAEDEVEEPPATITVPDVVGLPVSDAITVLEDAGFEAPQLTSFEDPEALVVSTSRAAGEEATEDAAISIVVAEKPKLTMGQENAVAKAKSYLDMTGFSRTGLIEQLEFEGFSTEDSTFGADNAGADWNAECAEKAQSYIDMTSFSRDGLYDQLAFEGFQPAEIEFGLAAVGY